MAQVNLRVFVIAGALTLESVSIFGIQRQPWSRTYQKWSGLALMYFSLWCSEGAVGFHCKALNVTLFWPILKWLRLCLECLHRWSFSGRVVLHFHSPKVMSVPLGFKYQLRLASQCISLTTLCLCSLFPWLASRISYQAVCNEVLTFVSDFVLLTELQWRSQFPLPHCEYNRCSPQVQERLG